MPKVIYAVCPVCKTTVRCRQADGRLYKHLPCPNQSRTLRKPRKVLPVGYALPTTTRRSA